MLSFPERFPLKFSHFFYLNINLSNGTSYSGNTCFDEKNENCMLTTKFELYSLKLNLASFKLPF